MYTLSEGLKKYLDSKRGKTEHTVEDDLVDGVKTLGGIAVKVRLIRGFPDRIVLLPDGIVEFVELKRPKGGKYEPLQKEWHKVLRKMGFRVYVLYNKKQVQDYLSERNQDD